MKILLTGADGFLGWHLRCRLRATTDHEVVAVGRAQWHRLAELAEGVDAIIHLAGINRAEPDELVRGNEQLAADVARAATSRSGPAPVVVFASSVQVGNGSPYAEGKQRAADLLRSAIHGAGGVFLELPLPNLFGEHGRPRYNSFVATFVDAVLHGQRPEIDDREIKLLHAQGAAAWLIDALDGGSDPTSHPPVVPVETSVVAVWETLRRFHATYPETGDVPEIVGDFQRDLFNTYRASLFPSHAPIRLTPRSDARGRLVETVRSHGRGGQSFVSTTVPGVTRGEHYHLHKFERFAVLDGEAVIALRRMFSSEVVEIAVSGSEPVVVDMPTMWVHNITNVGASTLTTLFWTDTLFDPEAPDTTPEPVRLGAAQETRT